MIRNSLHSLITTRISRSLLCSRIRQNVSQVRFARTKPNIKRTLNPETPKPIIQQTTAELSDKQLESKGMERVFVEQDILLLDALNRSRPGTPTDQRYKKQQKLLHNITNEDEKIQSFFVFLLQEALIELFEYPNPDELSQESEISNPEQEMEFEFKKSLMNNWNVTTERYKRFEILISVLESLVEKPNGAQLVPLEALVQIFDISKFLEDELLKLKVRCLSGDLIYSLKTVEFDPINESQYIESLMKFNKHKQANKLLMKRAETLNQRWWYELLIVNYIDLGDLHNAELVANTVKEKFYTDYLDTRIYLYFISKYLQANNIERVNYWVQSFEQSILELGFMIDDPPQPGLEATEEQVIQFLNRKDPPSKADFLSVINLHLGSSNSIFVNKVPYLIEFYLSLPSSSSSDLTELLLDYKYEYQTKILPLLSKMKTHKEVEEVLLPFLEQYRDRNATEMKQADLLDTYLQSLINVSGGFNKIIEEMRKVMHAPGGKLSSKSFYSLISAMINAKRLDEAFKVLKMLEDNDYILSNDQQAPHIFPRLSANHYVPFLRYFGRSGRIDEFNKVVKRFETHCNRYNPIILTQILNSLNKNKQHEETIKYIDLIILKNIHKQDFTSSQNYTKLYSSIWMCLKDYTYVMKESQKETKINGFPDLRYLFMKMIQDKVIPPREDYENIIETFIRTNDLYPVICVLEYMGLRHKIIPSRKINQLINKHSNLLNSKIQYQINKQYTRELQKLQSTQLSSKSLDPFAPKPEELNQEELFKDFFEPELELTSSQKDYYKLPILKLYKVLSMNFGIDLVYLREVYKDFDMDFDLDSIKMDLDKIK
ncbi:hypothetical protein WICMUC_002327 [Wickerhamomyces mucosus]|uniref:Mitochondrial group I intron splicing factor CCM1 n=1 Tax=Wickerhamomyces mucosus TaxID=1378264 RepID=A0A9P8PPW6_9ASCO|nr:hypothetical protein WICMUC_002327 [Wickerhamomyces mucosus]